MRIQYTIETGIVNLEGAHFPDDYIETYPEAAEIDALQAYVKIDLGELRRYFEQEKTLEPGEKVYRKLLVETMEDDDPDDYIVSSTEFLCEDDSMSSSELASSPAQIEAMGLDAYVEELKRG